MHRACTFNIICKHIKRSFQSELHKITSMKATPPEAVDCKSDTLPLARHRSHDAGSTMRDAMKIARINRARRFLPSE